MILLDFRVHRTSVGETRRLPRRVAFQSHAAFRAIARFVRRDSGTHGTKVFCGNRSHGGTGRISVLPMVGMGPSSMGTARVPALLLVRQLPEAGTELRPAGLAAEIMAGALMVQPQRGFLVHEHAANGILGHKTDGLLKFVKGK